MRERERERERGRAFSHSHIFKQSMGSSVNSSTSTLLSTSSPAPSPSSLCFPLGKINKVSLSKKKRFYSLPFDSTLGFHRTQTSLTSRTNVSLFPPECERLKHQTAAGVPDLCRSGRTPERTSLSPRPHEPPVPGLRGRQVPPGHPMVESQVNC